MKKGFTLIELLAVIVILAIVALIATPIVLNVIEDSEKKAYLIDCASIEKAAELYVIDNKGGVVPDGYTIKISDFKDEYLNKVKNVLDNEYVIVNKIDGELVYYYTGREKNPHEGYESLKDKIISNNAIVAATINGVDVKKVVGTKTGKETNMHNYVWFSGQLWQVLDINENSNSIKLVTANSTTLLINGNDLDNRSTFDGSWIKKWLDEKFYTILERKDLIVQTNFCLDAISTMPNGYTKKNSCSNSKNYNVGLLTYEDYLYAKDGENISDGGSFLDEAEYSFLITPYDDDETWLTYGSTPGGSTSFDSKLVPESEYRDKETNSTNYFFEGKGVRPVISIKDSVLVRTGDGTKGNPYVLTSEPSLDKNSNLINAKVGDYVYMDESNNPYTFTSETISAKVTYSAIKDKVRYRIVEILSDGRVKLERASVLNLTDSPGTNSAIKFYSSDSCYDSDHKVDCKNEFDPEIGDAEYVVDSGDSLAFFLNNASNGFYSWYSETAKNMISKNNWVLEQIVPSWRFNTHGSITILDRSVEAYVGLPEYSNIYAGNDLKKTYWLMNRTEGSPGINIVHYQTGGFVDGVYQKASVRPVIVLKSGVYVTGGTGTMTDPYSLGI